MKISLQSSKQTQFASLNHPNALDTVILKGVCGFE